MSRAEWEPGSPPGFEKLDAWRVADDLAVNVYRMAKRLPRDDAWLKDQIIRAAVSAPANIAEGYGRASNKEFAQFLVVAHSSLYEVEYFLHFMRRVELLDEDTCGKLRGEARRASQVTYGLMRAARRDTETAGTQRRYLREESATYGPGE